MKKRLLSALLALVMIASVGLVSCKQEKDPAPVTEQTETDTGTGTETEKPSETASDETSAVKFTLHDVSGKPGEIVEMEISMDVSAKMNSVALYELTYDKDILTFKGFSDWKDFEDNRCVIPGGFDESKEVIVLAMKDTSSLNESICKVLFEINANAEAGTTAVEMTSLVKHNSDVLESSVDGAEITIAK